MTTNVKAFQVLVDGCESTVDSLLKTAEIDGIRNMLEKHLDYQDLCQSLDSPKVFVCSLPHGNVGDSVVEGLHPFRTLAKYPTPSRQTYNPRRPLCGESEAPSGDTLPVNSSRVFGYRAPLGSGLLCTSNTAIRRTFGADLCNHLMHQQPSCDVRQT